MVVALLALAFFRGGLPFVVLISLMTIPPPEPRLKSFETNSKESNRTDRAVLAARLIVCPKGRGFGRLVGLGFRHRAAQVVEGLDIGQGLPNRLDGVAQVPVRHDGAPPHGLGMAGVDQRREGVGQGQKGLHWRNRWYAHTVIVPPFLTSTAPFARQGR
jgi:hypothetical protein